METFIENYLDESNGGNDETNVAEERDESVCFGIRDCICPVCGKRFIPAPQHVYKQYKTKKKVCSWTCVIVSEREFLNHSNKKTVKQQTSVVTNKSLALKSLASKKSHIKKKRYRPTIEQLQQAE